MGLDIKYSQAFYFQQVIHDKDTGAVLANGTIEFFRDSDRITPKEVFKLSGTPPNYTYTSIGTSVTLSSIGSVQDGSGNDIALYFHPYDVIGDLDLYYIVFKNSLGVEQFTREGQPNLAEEPTEADQVKNYIPNGQFLLHHWEGWRLMTQTTEEIAYGSWYFQRSSGSTATDYIEFARFGSYVENPTTSPRYALYVKCESPDATDPYKEVWVIFRDVNKFASDTKKFTLSFDGRSLSGSTSPLLIKIVKNYNDSPQSVQTLPPITLTTSWVTHNETFIFGNNSGKDIALNDSDNVAIAFTLPPTSTFYDGFDNIVLTAGEVTLTGFPDTPNREFIRESLIGNELLPAYDRSNLYLPVRLGINGLEYDTDGIGEYVSKSDNHLGKDELWCHGQYYFVDNYSTVGIPYQRLYQRWAAQSHLGLAMYGVGDVEMSMRQGGVQTDAEFKTGTDILRVSDPNPPKVVYQSYTAVATGSVISFSFFYGGGSLPDLVTFVFKFYDGVGVGGTLKSTLTGITIKINQWNTVTLTTPFTQTATQQYTVSMELEQTIHNPEDLQFKGNKAGGYAGGVWSEGGDILFEIKIKTGALTSTHRLQTESTAAVTPAADGAIPTGFTFTPVQPSPYQVDITFVPGSSITAGAYWVFHNAVGKKFIVWYEVSGSGTQPVESATLYRKIVITTSDSDISVANKTAVSINSYSVRIPDCRGLFLRVTDDGAGRDPGAASRTDRGDGTTGDAVGTLQDLADDYNSGGALPSPKNRYFNMAVKY